MSLSMPWHCSGHELTLSRNYSVATNQRFSYAQTVLKCLNQAIANQCSVDQKQFRAAVLQLQPVFFVFAADDALRVVDHVKAFFRS